MACTVLADPPYVAPSTPLTDTEGGGVSLATRPTSR